MLADMDALDAFASDIRVPAISSLQEVDHVLREVALFPTAQEQQRAMQLLQQAGFNGEGKVESLSLGVKKLLSMTEMARQDREGAADKLLTSFMDLTY